jgi:hypothetical protein
MTKRSAQFQQEYPYQQPDPSRVDEQPRETRDDFLYAEWEIWKAPDGGDYAQVSTHKGMPEASHCRDRHGVGNYMIIPLDAEGRTRPEFSKSFRCAPPVDPTPVGSSTTPAALVAPENSDDLPPFVRMMLAQQAEERREARRRADDSEARREKWEREQRDREWAKAEREERERLRAEERAAEERKSANERFNTMMASAITLAGSFVQAFAAKPAGEPKSQVNEALLAAVLQRSASPAPAAGGSLKDSLDLLLVLDQVADRRAERAAPAVVEKEDDGLVKAMMGMLPAILAMRGGGGGAEAAAQAMAALQHSGEGAPDPRGIAEGFVTGILRDPDALAEIASRDPDGTAKVFLAAVQRNPSLQAAVQKAIAEAGESG